MLRSLGVTCCLGILLLLLAPGRASAAPSARVDPAAVAAALRHDPVHVDPRSSLALTPAEERQLHGDAAATSDPLYVVALGRLPSGESTHGVAEAVARELPDPAWVVVYADDTLPSFGWHYADDDHAQAFYDATAGVDHDQGTPSDRLLAITGRLSGRLDTPDPVYLFGPPADRTPPAPASPLVRAARAVAVVLVGLLAAGALVMLARLAGRRRASALRTRRLGRQVARGRHDDRSIQARRDVLDLGARLDETDVDAGDDREQWQAALDSYDRAGRLLDHAAGTDDYQQVVDLCRAGQQQLARALAGRR